MSLLELISFPQAILKVTALWPQRDFSWFYRFRTGLSLVLVISLVVSLTYNAAWHSNDLIKLSESLYMLISVVNSLLKVILLSANGEAFLRLLDMLDMASFGQYNQLYEAVISDFKGTVAKVQKYYKIQVNSVLVFMAIFPVIESKPLPMDFPHFNNGTFHYPFYVFEMVSLYIAACNNMAIDLLTVGFISVAAIQLKLLNRKLVDTKRNVDRSSTLVYLNQCCMHFSDIEEFVKCLLEVLSVIIFVQLSTSIVAICNSGMMILTVNPLSIEALSLFLYMTTMFAQLSMYCWFGNVVYLESLEVGTSSYMWQWYEHGNDVRKTLFMLMERTKKPLEIRGIRFVTLSFSALIVILKWTYSCFTLLRNTMMKKE